MLISQQDIYCPKRSLLLLKAGQPVDESMLDKLMQFQVDPTAFRIDSTAQSDREITSNQHAGSPVLQRVQQLKRLFSQQLNKKAYMPKLPGTTPRQPAQPQQEALSSPYRKPQQARQRTKPKSSAKKKFSRPVKVLIYEPDRKALTRLLHQLEQVGISSSQVKVASHLEHVKAYLAQRAVHTVLWSVDRVPNQTQLDALHQATNWTKSGKQPNWVLMPPQKASAWQTLTAHPKLVHNSWEVLPRPVHTEALKSILS